MTDIIKLGVSLILIGFAVVFMGTILSAGNADFGGLIMIGPIPIAFGSSPEMTVIAMVIGLLLMLVFFLVASGIIFSHREYTGQEEEGIPYGNTGEKKIKGGGVILIGPVPIVFGSDKRFALIVMILTIVILLLWIVFIYTFSR